MSANGYNLRPRPPKTIDTGSFTVDTFGALPQTSGAHRDHIPSSASLRRSYGRQLGVGKIDRNSALGRRLDKMAPAMSVSPSFHKSGRTYGRKNYPAKFHKDSHDLAYAAHLDVKAYQDQLTRGGIVKAKHKLRMLNTASRTLRAKRRAFHNEVIANALTLGQLSSTQ